MFTCLLSGVQDLSVFQYSEKKTMTMVSAFKLFLVRDLHDYVTKANTQMASKFALNFIMIQKANETVKYAVALMSLLPQKPEENSVINFLSK